MSATSTALVRSTPSTPTTKPTIAQLPPLPPSPGTWRHPKFTEIIHRQASSDFSDRNRRYASTNAIALFLSFFLASELKSTLNSTLSLINMTQSHSALSWTLNLFRLLLLVNLGFSLRPVLPYIKTKDEILDIPLTPSQRVLLGLAPSTASTPASTGSLTAGTGKYITPPRYHRSSGSFSPSPQSSNTPTDRRSISANNTPNNPFSTPRHHMPPSFSPSSSSASHRSTHRTTSTSISSYKSPLLQRAVISKSRDEFGSSTNGLGRSQSVKERSSRLGTGTGSAGSRADRRGSGVETETPSDSPTRVKRTPGLNYKWLYEKGRALPRSESMQF